MDRHADKLAPQFHHMWQVESFENTLYHRDTFALRLYHFYFQMLALLTHS